MYVYDTYMNYVSRKFGNAMSQQWGAEHKREEKDRDVKSQTAQRKQSRAVVGLPDILRRDSLPLRVL